MAKLSKPTFYLAKNKIRKNKTKQKQDLQSAEKPNHFACSEQFHKISTRNLLERAAHNDQIS